jgi:hypothetical protein
VARLLALGILIRMLTLIGLPNVFAKKFIGTSSYDDGFREGSQQAAIDLEDGSSFNAVCDPNGLHISDAHVLPFTIKVELTDTHLNIITVVHKVSPQKNNNSM